MTSDFSEELEKTVRTNIAQMALDRYDRSGAEYQAKLNARRFGDLQHLCEWVRCSPDDYPKGALCHTPTLLCIRRANDTPLSLCTEHLWVYLLLYGPQTIEVEFDRVLAARRVRERS